MIERNIENGFQMDEKAPPPPRKPKLSEVTRGGTYDFDPRGREKRVLICRNCGSERISETWPAGTLECLACGAKGRPE